MSAVVILWCSTTAPGLEIVESYARDKGAQVSRATMRDLPTRALAAASYAPVVAVVEDDRAATEALGAGVDEIVRRADVSSETIERAVSRAEARARGRLRAMTAANPADEAASFASLLDWIAIELVACLSGAVLESELLEDSVRRLVKATDTPPTSPRPADIFEMLETVKDSQRRTKEVLQAVRSLSGADAEATSVPEVLEALARILHSRSVPLLDVEVDAASTSCTTSVPVPKLVAALVAIIGCALDRATSGRTEERTKLSLRAFVAEGATIVEVEDDASEETSSGPGRTSPFGPVRAAMNDQGGDLIVDAAFGRTTVRLVLPPAEERRAPSRELAHIVPATNRAN